MIMGGGDMWSWNPRAWDWETGSANDTPVERARSQEDATKRANENAIAEAKAAEQKAGAIATESVTSKKRAIARSRTVYTSPLGLSTEAQTASKMLLGQ
jgi:hypothetical protein